MMSLGMRIYPSYIGDLIVIQYIGDDSNTAHMSLSIEILIRWRTIQMYSNSMRDIRCFFWLDSREQHLQHLLRQVDLCKVFCGLSLCCWAIFWQLNSFDVLFPKFCRVGNLKVLTHVPRLSFLCSRAPSGTMESARHADAAVSIKCCSCSDWKGSVFERLSTG